MRNAISNFSLAFLVVLVTACGSLGLKEPQSLDQRLAYSYGIQTAVNDAATSALVAGSITKQDAQFVLKSSTDARVLLDAARAAVGAGDISTAESRLVLATNILVQLQNYLRSHP